ncbi:MAG: phosphate acetyltransferase, partial [Duncaniella sp.]|nr:phosphate acetyltransferase [Duncaniella sp.]
MGLFEKLTAKAKSNRQRIVLPEGNEPRTLTAADRIIADGIADIILIGDPNEIMALAKDLKLENLDKATIVNPAEESVIDKYAPLYFELRKKKGISMEEARKTAANPLYLGCLMVKAGDADGQVAGALNTTGNVLRAAFQIIKTMPGIDVVSGAFVMVLPEGINYGTDGLLIFADCAV